ncbi:hypothetical protein CYMTET_8664, partial [Cymbomonas tetramitiformis]
DTAQDLEESSRGEELLASADGGESDDSKSEEDAADTDASTSGVSDSDAAVEVEPESQEEIATLPPSPSPPPSPPLPEPSPSLPVAPPVNTADLLNSLGVVDFDNMDSLEALESALQKLQQRTDSLMSPPSPVSAAGSTAMASTMSTAATENADEVPSLSNKGAEDDASLESELASLEQEAMVVENREVTSSRLDAVMEEIKDDNDELEADTGGAEPVASPTEEKMGCASWYNGHQASLRKSYWVQTHGTGTVSQHQRADCGKSKKDSKCDKKALEQGLRYHHMPALALLPNKTIFAAWQAAWDTEGENDQHIRISVSRDSSGKSWAHSWPLPVRKRGAQWGPVPHLTEDGTLLLFYTESSGECIRDIKPKARWPPGGDVRVTSTKDLVRWTPPRTIFGLAEDGGIPKVLSNKLTVLSSGEWVIPFWRENQLLSKSRWPEEKEHCRTADNSFGENATNSAHPSAGVLISADKGQTWTARGDLGNVAIPGTQKSTWLIENSVVEVGKGGLLMLFRTLAGYVYMSLSSDKGLTWTPPRPTDIPNPDSKIQAMRLEPAGPIILAFNDHKRTAIVTNGKEEKLADKCRTQLTLALSADNGRTWRRILVLRGGQAPGLRFHYPWMLQVGCKLLVAYSKFYVTGFKHSENDRELGIRLAHVQL